MYACVHVPIVYVLWMESLNLIPYHFSKQILEKYLDLVVNLIISFKFVGFLSDGKIINVKGKYFWPFINLVLIFSCNFL